MNPKLLGSFAFAFALLVGCASNKKETTSSTEVVAEKPAPARTEGGLYWTERAYPTGDKRTSVVVLESGTPGEVSAGVPYEYILRVRNISELNLENVVVMDKPRGNFDLRGSTPKTVDGKDLRWDLGNMRPKEVKEIRISGTALGEGQVIHCADVDWRSQFCSTTQVVKPGLTISKSATAATLICDPITYSVTVGNSGTGTTRNVVIEDRLPAGVETLDGKNTVQFTLPALEPGESKTFSWKAKATKTGRFTGMATARADGNLDARSGEVSTTVTRPVLAFEKKGTKQTYMGRAIAYEMTLRNTGDGEARDVLVSDTIPGGARFLEASEGAALEGNVVRWKLGTMAPGATKTFNMKISSAGAAKLRATATATAYCADTVTAMAETEVTGIAAILLEVVDLNDPVEIGGATTYVITATNQGSAPATNVRIAVTLEDGMGYGNATGSTKAEQTGQKVLFKPLPSLAPGEKASWRVEVKAVREGDMRIKVAMTSDQLERPVEETEATKFYK